SVSDSLRYALDGSFCSACRHCAIASSMMCRFFSSTAIVVESRSFRRRFTTWRRREISMSYVAAGDSLPVGLLASATPAAGFGVAGVAATVLGVVVSTLAGEVRTAAGVG